MILYRTQQYETYTTLDSKHVFFLYYHNLHNLLIGRKQHKSPNFGFRSNPYDWKRFFKPVTQGGEDSRDDVGVRCGVGMVRITPALVPTHKRSRHTIMDVTRKQAALCWRIISSQPYHKIGFVGNLTFEILKAIVPISYWITWEHLIDRWSQVDVTNAFMSKRMKEPDHCRSLHGHPHTQSIAG